MRIATVSQPMAATWLNGKVQVASAAAVSARICRERRFIDRYPLTVTRLRGRTALRSTDQVTMGRATTARPLAPTALQDPNSSGASDRERKAGAWHRERGSPPRPRRQGGIGVLSERSAGSG